MKINSKEDILQSALDIIAFDGIDKLSMTSLADKLGVNKSSLYHWFASKEDILEECFAYGHRKLMAKGFRLSLDDDALIRASKAWQDIFTDPGLIPYLRTVFSLRYSDERAREEARAIKLMIRSQIEVIAGNSILSGLFSALLIEQLIAELDGEHQDIEDTARECLTLMRQDKLS